MSDLRDKLYLTCAEAAELLQCGRNTITRLIQSGRLKATNRGLGQKKPRWMIHIEDIRVLRPPPEAPIKRRRGRPSRFVKLARRID